MIPRRDLPVRVTARTDLSPTCFRLTVSAPDEIDAVPGQFGMLACGDTFDPLLRRAFSLAGVARHGGLTEVELLIKEVGRGTAQLRHTAVGAELRLLAPLGKGFTLASGGGPLALVAGGIGLPPVLFAAEVLAARGATFDLYLGAVSEPELLEVERCGRAVAAVGGELVLATDDGSRGEKGFVTDVLDCRLETGRPYARALACGPNPMLAAMAKLVRRLGLEVELSLEEAMACGVGVCLGCVVELADGRVVPSCREGPVFSAERLAARWWL
jgi:dihydroorotate dehydrogenase electron transfer subunit